MPQLGTMYNDCGKAYVTQTGQDFKTRFNEHKRSDATPKLLNIQKL